MEQMCPYRNLHRLAPIGIPRNSMDLVLGTRLLLLSIVKTFVGSMDHTSLVFSSICPIFETNLRVHSKKTKRFVQTGYRGMKSASTRIKQLEETTRFFPEFSRHETVNGRLKRFQVLHMPLRHELQFHADCFYAVSNITQFVIDMEEPFFS